MITLKIGDRAPDFELADQKGDKIRLSSFKGKKIILYFYPKDDTSGCTKEACDFRDNFAALKKLNVEVLGISNDDLESHKSFSSKYNLNFPILSDADKKVSKEYGVYEIKQNYGREYYGITRSTFLIDENGKIEKIFYKVNPEAHIGEIMEEINKYIFIKR